MKHFTKILRELTKQRDRTRADAERLDRAIQALSEAAGRGRRQGPRRGVKKRHMSVAARKRIAAAQRARWARVRAEKLKARA
jgi:hypothetical protein